MSETQTLGPKTDPALIFEHYRGIYATALLTAGVVEFDVFGRLADGPRDERELVAELRLTPRAGNVLLVALRAMGLLVNEGNRVGLTEMGREHLVKGDPFDVSDYVSQAADNPAVREIIGFLKSSRPKGEQPQEQGVGFIYRDGITSAMEQEATARKFTLALAGRAKNVAPVLAQRIPMGDARVLLDVAGGTGIYSIACLKRYANLRAILWDRPQVLKVAREFAEAEGVASRIEFRPGDMFTDSVPGDCDRILLSNVLHDWDVPENKKLVARLADAMPPGGQLLIHDVFLTDALDGPLSVALYSANLFCVTEGRAYSAAEYRGWLREVGLTTGEIVPTLAHCGVLPASRA